MPDGFAEAVEARGAMHRSGKGLDVDATQGCAVVRIMVVFVTKDKVLCLNITTTLL